VAGAIINKAIVTKKLLVIVLTLNIPSKPGQALSKGEGDQLVSLTVRQVADYTLPLLRRGLGRG